MAIYYVQTVVEFSGEVEADSPEEAERLGWHWDTELQYDGVYSINVDFVSGEDEEDSE